MENVNIDVSGDLKQVLDFAGDQMNMTLLRPLIQRLSIAVEESASFLEYFGQNPHYNKRG